MKTLRRSLLIVLVSVSGIGAAIIMAVNALADVPQPVLRIAALGSNSFSITITNGVVTTNYTLYWTPALGNASYPWEVLGPGDVGETNFIVDAGNWTSGFFKVTIGNDLDGDGFPDWEDANPNDPAIGILAVTIDSPLNGAVLQ